MAEAGAAALPVLMYHSVPASGPGDALSVPRPLLRRQLTALRDNGFELLGLTAALAAAGAGRRVVGLTFDDGYADFLAVPELLEDLGASATLYVSTAHVGTTGRLIPTAGRLLDWAEVSDLAASPTVEVGSHAHVHQPLDVLPPRDLVAQVASSRRLLAERAGVQAVSFCYPNGYHGPRVRRAVAAAGFANACIVGRRVARVGGDRYAVPRVQVTDRHDESGVLRLVEAGETGLTARVKPLVYPAWRLARRTVYRTTGRQLT